MSTQHDEVKERQIELLITLDEAAKRLSLSRYKLEQLFASGEVARPVVLGGCVRVLAKDLDNYLRRQRTEALRKRRKSVADAMAWMTRTRAEEAEIAANQARRFSPGDPSRLP